MITNKQAEQIIRAIITDLTDRSGLGDEWGNIDNGVKKEIRAEWRRLILATNAKDAEVETTAPEVQENPS